MNKKVKIFLGLVLFIITMLILPNNNYATSETLEVVKKSGAFEKWENLSEEERKNTIQPLYQDITLKNSIKRSAYNALLASSSTTETYYNLKDNISNINVKNQRQTGACWAFSFSNVLETTISNKYSKTCSEISPLHMEYVASNLYNKEFGYAGNVYMAIAYSLSEYGPVFENDFKFNDYYDEENNSETTHYLTDLNTVDLNKTVIARIEEATFFANIFKSYTDTATTYKNSSAWIGAKTYTNEEVQSIRNLIKEHIKENGAVTATLYSDMGVTADGEYVSTGGYFNEETNAYYCNGTLKTANHAVTIIGWDDNFSKENFAEGHQPLNDGAYIVLNSWGTEFGNEGYFYVSYDDTCIEQAIVGIDAIKEYDETNTSYYDYIYQYDELGITQAIRMTNDEQTEYLTSVWAANVYPRQNTEETEYVTEIGIYLYTTQGVEVYLNAESDDLNNSTLVASYTGTNALEAGYHTLKLASPIKLTGDTFAVEIKYINSEGVQLPIECDWVECGFTTASNIYDTVVSEPGESYISKDGENWSDMYNYKLSDEYTLVNSNACIKAFTEVGVISEPTEVEVSGVELNENEATIKEGETVTLVATVLPENATNKVVTWETSNEEIASVENGIVTGLSTGTATITVITGDGEFTDTCVVTVEENTPENVVISVSGVSLDKNEVTIEEGEKVTLVATVLPENATNKVVTWKISNEEIASVENGIVTGISAGTATITATTEDGEFTDICTVTVEEETYEEVTIEVTGVTLDKTSLTMQVEDRTNLVATIQPSNATNKDVIWTSTNENVATVNENGVITAVMEGTTRNKSYYSRWGIYSNM